MSKLNKKYFFYLFVHTNTFQNPFHVLIFMFIKRIYVFLDSISEDVGKLRDAAKLFSQFFQGKVQSITVVK